MNNSQLIDVFPRHPLHSIHHVQSGHAFNRWLTFTAKLPRIGGRNWPQIRRDVLDALYEDWEGFRTQTIELPI